MSKPILTVGSIALDSIETPYGRVKEVGGGSAVHFSLAASVFTTARVVGVVGEDFPGEIMEFLTSKKIDISGIEIKKGENTFRWSGYYEKDMAVAHTIETKLNVFSDFKPSIPKEFKSSPLVFLANIDPQLQLQVIEEMENPELICADTMNYWIERKKELLWEVIAKVDFLILNDQEICLLTEEYNLLKATQKIFSRGCKAGIVVKKGENGSTVFFRNGGYFSIPGYLTENVVDPTGAGDSFAGGFMGYLATQEKISRQNIKLALLYGNVMGSFNVEGFGYAKVATLGIKDIEQRASKIKEIFTI